MLQGRCLAYGDGGPFGPIRAALGAEIEGDSAAAVARAARAELETRARERPLVLSLDDVHWAEPAFLDLVENVVDLAARVPILVVCAARPELLERRTTWAGGLPRSGAIRLDRLAHDESKRLVDNLLGESDLPDPVVEHIVRSADGVPLFVEELLAILVDRAVLRRVRGRWTTSELPTLAVPPTVQALITARVDRLPDGERFVLELGSVQGTRFERAAVADVGRDDLSGDLDAHLESLVAKELLRRDPDDATAFAFRHDLVRDAAYESIPKRARAELHARFAEWLEQRVREREAVAFHRERARGLRAELGEDDPRLIASE